VLAALVEAGADLVLSGHVHQAAAAERREFEVLDGERSVVVVTAPGLGRPRPHRLGEAQGLHVIDVLEPEIRVETRAAGEDGWVVSAARSFPRRST
jgi:hypothetical protein